MIRISPIGGAAFTMAGIAAVGVGVGTSFGMDALRKHDAGHGTNFTGFTGTAGGILGGLAVPVGLFIAGAGVLGSSGGAYLGGATLAVLGAGIAGGALVNALMPHRPS